MGKAVLLLLVLVGIAVGGAFYNYNRNAGLVADLAKPRPYAQFKTADLEKLIQAQQRLVQRAKAQTASAPAGEDAIARQDASDVGGKAQAFAGFQRSNEHWKAQRGKVLDEEIELQQMLFEKSIRDRHLDDPDYVFKKRVLTF